ncbi:MAG: extracellular solute-binding protein [Clostridia bacterium]|nr:extracellular solute-binding protein [Clostridia bacterium]
MKKNSALKRAGTLVLAFVLLAVPLTACGGNSGNDGQEALSEFVYVPQYTGVPKEITDISNPYLSGDTVYFTAYVPVHADGTEATQEEVDAYNNGGMLYQSKSSASDITVSSAAGTTVTTTEAVPAPATSDPEVSDITYKTFIYAIGKDGTNYHKLADYVPTEGSQDKYSYSSLDRLVADAQGNVWVAESISKTIFDLPEGFDETKDDPYQYYVSDERQSLIRKLSSTGAELASIDLSQYVDSTASADSKYGGGSFYINYMLTDDAGNVYISDGNNTVYVIGNDAKFLFKISVDGYISSLIKLKDGTMGVSTSASEADADGVYRTTLKVIDLNTKDWGKDYTIPNSVWNTSDGGDKYDFCYTDSSSLFGYDLVTAVPEKILTWLNCDVDGDNIRFSTVQDDGNVFAISNSYSDDGVSSFEIITLVKTPRSEVKQKTTLRLATMWVDWNLKKELLKFNKTNPDYRIEITDYSEFNTDQDYTAGITKLNTEIIAGNIPDMIDISNLPYKQYAAKGLLEDLYPYIESDSELSRDDLMPGILNAVETEGKLYQLVSSFSVVSIVGSPDVVGTEMGWTMDDMQKIIEEHPDADSPFGSYMTRDNVLQYLCMLNMDNYMNWQTGECSFNSDEFKKLLTFAKSFPEKIEESSDGEDWVDPSVLVSEGRQLFSIFNASDFQSYQYYKAMFGGAITFKGLPTESGVGNIAQINGGLAMTTACKAKEGAWQFMRVLLSEDYQENLSWGYPISQKAFDKKLAEAMVQEYTTDENGNKVPVSSGGMSMGGDMSVDFYAITQEEADQIVNMINSVKHTAVYDQSLLDIISEESAFFFSGEKTVDQVADIIQSRMSIYINEQR